MKTLLVFSLILIATNSFTYLFLGTDAALAIELQPGDKCKYNSHLYTEGDVWAGNQCTEIRCSRFNETHMQTTYVTCGVAAPGPGCKLVEGNMKLPYPKCCPQVVCS